MLKRYAHFVLFLGCLPILSHSSNIPPESDYDKNIDKLYKQLPPKLANDKKLDVISRRFIGYPYVLGPLGEGYQGKYDQDPLYRTDQYDCLTYVDTVIGLTLANNLEDYKTINTKLRYKNNQPKFTERNHFTSLDWNKNNADKGFVSDITYQIKDRQNKPVATSAKTTIDKHSWYRHMGQSVIKLNDASHSSERLQALRNESKHMKKQLVETPYIPLTTLFNEDGEPNEYLFSQIPHGSVIEIVRPNWALKDKIGTNLNISHLGLGMRENGQLMFRHASSTDKKVVNIPLQTYLKKYLTSPTIKGINIQRINLTH